MLLGGEPVGHGSSSGISSPPPRRDRPGQGDWRPAHEAADLDRDEFIPLPPDPPSPPPSPSRKFNLLPPRRPVLPTQRAARLPSGPTERLIRQGDWISDPTFDVDREHATGPGLLRVIGPAAAILPPERHQYFGLDEFAKNAIGFISSKAWRISPSNRARPGPRRPNVDPDIE